MLADTLAALVARRGQLHPDRPALVSTAGGGVSYRQLAEDAERIAGVLRSRGIAAGDRVAILADHTLGTWRVLHGMARAGVVPVLANWRLTADELAHIVRDAESRLVLATDRWQPLAAEVASRCDVAAEPVDELADAPAAGPAGPFPEPDDTVVQMYTSGTTGLPKGVCTTHRNVLALLDVFTGELPGFASDARQMVAAPLFHIAGYGFGIGSLAVGTPMHLLEQFDPAAALAAIERHRITHTLLVPAMLQMVVAAPGAAGRDTSSLRGVLYGGSPMSVSLMRSVIDVLGCRLTQAYGMTETTGIATLLRYDDHEAGLSANCAEDGALLASAGRPVLGTSVRIDAPDGRGRGAILVRSPMVMPGYWRRPDETAAALDADGWLRTGDVGRIDERGYLHVVDRQKDLVISKGENIFPGEVERVVVEHPAVVEAAVVGVPDDEYGEALCAVVELRAGASLTLGELQELCRGQLAGFKVPRRLEVVDVLPRTPSGKVLRRVIRDGFWADRSRQVN